MIDSLLLVSTQPNDLKFAEEVAKNAGLQLKPFSSPDQAVQFIAEKGAMPTLFDCSSKKEFQAIQKAFESGIGLFSDKLNANHLHFLSGEDLQNSGYLLDSPVFGNFVSRGFGSDIQAAGTRYGHIIKANLLERAFGLDKLLPPGSKIQGVKFTDTTQKQEGVEAVKNYLLAAKFKSRMATVIANAVDEIIMNAMFDAPVDATGKPLFLTTPRDTKMPLGDKRLVEMYVGFDGTYVGITAVDFYGSLDKKKLFSHIAKRYVEEEYKVKSSVAGAGIGLATIFRSGGSFLFSSDSGSRTEVTVFFRRADNYREFKDQFRFISNQFYF